jgi:hypothetical protein
LRKLCAKAIAEGYLRCDVPRFLEEIQADPDLAIEVLKVVKQIFRTLVAPHRIKITAIDPFSKTPFPINARDTEYGKFDGY